jgi:hypothetical protein
VYKYEEEKPRGPIQWREKRVRIDSKKDHFDRESALKGRVNGECNRVAENID